jgi:hypothetical protein
MGKAIIYYEGAYNEYTTVADGPCWEGGLTLEQLKMVVKKQYGEEGLKALPERLELAHKTGTSFQGITLKVTFEEFIKRYLTLNP